MVRTQIQLTEAQSVQVKRLAAERGVSVAEIVREGVDRVLQESRGPSREERTRRALAAVGRFRGPRDLATRHDEHFVDAVADRASE